MLVGLWLGVLLVVLVHEAGHACAARALGVPSSTLVVGLGPRLVRFVGRRRLIEVRALPVIGWIEMDRDSIGPGSARVAVVYLAGPAASLLFSMVLLIGCAASFGGPMTLRAGDVTAAVSTSYEGAAATFSVPLRPVAGAVGSMTGLMRRDDPVRSTMRPERSIATELSDDRTVSTVIGITAGTRRNVDRYGFRWILVVMAALSAGVAGLNMLPAWGLDGHGALDEAASWVRWRSVRVGAPACRFVRMLGGVTLGLGVVFTVAAIVRDLIAIF